MSYEGCVMYLCAAGHLITKDAYFDFEDPRKQKCIRAGCDEPLVWYNSIDQTNHGGVFPDLVLINEEQTERCPHCGTIQITSRATHKIPTNSGHVFNRDAVKVPFCVVRFRYTDGLTGETALADTEDAAVEAERKSREAAEEKMLKDVWGQIGGSRSHKENK